MKKTNNRKYNVHANITGKRFGKLVGVRIVGYSTTSRGSLVPQWLCKCDCGVEHVASIYALQGGRVTSCGCNLLSLRKTLPAGHVTHGDSKARLYSAYMTMIHGCYGKRFRYETGAFVCPEWLGGDTYESHDYTAGYTAFKEWAMRPVSEGGGGYSPALKQHIERINPEMGFMPGNCVFVTKYGVRVPGVNDGNPMSMRRLAIMYNAPDMSVSLKLKSGWSINAIFHALKFPELKMRKLPNIDRYCDKNGNRLDIPDYGAEIICLE